MKLLQAWGAKLKVSLQLSPLGLFVTVDSRRYIYTCACKCGRLPNLTKVLLAWYHLMASRAGDEKTRRYTELKLSHCCRTLEVEVAVLTLYFRMTCLHGMKQLVLNSE